MPINGIGDLTDSTERASCAPSNAVEYVIGTAPYTGGVRNIKPPAPVLVLG